MRNKKRFYFPILLSFTLELISCGNSISSFLFNNNDNNENVEDTSSIISEEKEETKIIQAKKISFNQSSYTIGIEEEIKIDVIVFPKTATSKVSLECTNPDLLKIDNEKHTITGLECGTTDLIAKSDNGLSISCKVTIVLGKLRGFSTNKNKIELEIGYKNVDTIDITTTPKKAAQNLKPLVLDSSIVSVDSNFNVEAKSAGQTTVTIFNDINDDGIADNDELKKDVVVHVHDFINVEPTLVEATCEKDGLKTWTCKCGCNDSKQEIIPATNHSMVENVIKQATCTESGIIESKCTHKNCDKQIITEIPALGHDFSKEVIKDDNIASIGNAIYSTSYYLNCSRCDHHSDTETFNHGYSNYIYSTKFHEKFGVDGPRMAETYKRAVETFESFKDKDLGTSISVNVKGLDMREDILTKVNNRLFCENPQYFYVGSLKSTVQSGGKFVTFRYNTPEEYRLLDNRTPYQKILDDIYDEVSLLIRKDATDVEKALIIYTYVGNYFTYKDKQYNFMNGIVSKTGVCQIYSKLFRYLATRFNLGAFCAYSTTHAWIHVNIDDKWYALDALWGESNSSVSLSWFCLDQETVNSKSNSAHNVHDSMYVELNNPSLNKSLMTLYKDGLLHGVYYSLDTLLENVNDSSAKYVINFTVDNIAGYAINNSWNYHVSEVQTALTSASFASLEFKSNYDVTLSAPSAFFKQKNISYSETINKVNI